MLMCTLTQGQTTNVDTKVHVDVHTDSEERQLMLTLGGHVDVHTDRGTDKPMLTLGCMLMCTQTEGEGQTTNVDTRGMLMCTQTEGQTTDVDTRGHVDVHTDRGTDN